MSVNSTFLIKNTVTVSERSLELKTPEQLQEYQQLVAPYFVDKAYQQMLPQVMKAAISAVILLPHNSQAQQALFQRIMSVKNEILETERYNRAMEDKSARLEWETAQKKKELLSQQVQIQQEHASHQRDKYASIASIVGDQEKEERFYKRHIRNNRGEIATTEQEIKVQEGNMEQLTEELQKLKSDNQSLRKKLG